MSIQFRTNRVRARLARGRGKSGFLRTTRPRLGRETQLRQRCARIVHCSRTGFAAYLYNIAIASRMLGAGRSRPGKRNAIGPKASRSGTETDPAWAGRADLRRAESVSFVAARDHLLLVGCLIPVPIYSHRAISCSFRRAAHLRESGLRCHSLQTVQQVPRRHSVTPPQVLSP